MTSATIILAGAGHAHLYIASRAGEYRRRDIRLILIDPGSFWYSGLATGMLNGQYSADDDQIDPRALIESAGGEFIQDSVASVDPKTRQLSLSDGTRLTYDWLSLNIGSQVNDNGLVDPAHVQCWPVKPIENLYRLRKNLEGSIRQSGHMPPVCVIGGGPTGSEIAANLIGLAERDQVTPSVTLITNTERLLADSAPKGAATSLQRSLEKRGLRLMPGKQVTGTEPGKVLAGDGQRVNAEHVVLATGLEAKPLTREIGVTAGRQGVRVNRYLQSVDNPALFAAGDCADFQPRPLPKLGVFGVRAAEIVHHNLLACHDGQPLRAFEPQKVWLAILNLGNGEALALWWRLWWRGRSSLWLKDRIDRQFLQGYRALYRRG